jgi:tRNA(Ile)-lysidine synthase
MTFHEKTIKSLRNLGVSSNSSLLITVSGGPDSLALAHVMQSLRGTEAFASVAVAHVNHQLRGDESNREEEAVRNYCKSRDVAFELKRVDTLRIAEHEKTGIEETARKLRYEFFEELTEKIGFDFVLTAHTANDQAETVILNMIRGSGVRGLAGIPPKRKLGDAFVIRPWLGVTKAEILEYLQEHHLIAAHDASNDELIFRRNQVRQKVMPALEEVWPDREPVKTLAALAERMRELSIFLDTLAKEKLELLQEDGGLSIAGVQSLGGFLLHTVIEAWIHREFGHYGLTSEETPRIETWIASTSPRMDLRRGLSLRKDGNILRLESDGREMFYNE